MSQDPQKSVIIIGAGLAGMTAADEILRGHPKAKVTVIEAMAEAGGRTRSIQIEGATFDLGAQWIGDPQKYATQLAKRSGNTTMDQPYEGKKFLQLGDNIQTYQCNVPRDTGVIPQIHLQLMMWKLDRYAKTVPLDNPRNCPKATEWDSMTVHSWIYQNVWFDKVRRILQLIVRTLLGCETNQVSFLFFLWFIHHNHGLDCLINVQNGLEKRKLVKGTQFLSKFLQSQVVKNGGKVYFNSLVTKVEHNQKGVTVQTAKGQKYTASYLIVAMPPPAVTKIIFEPQLSRQRRFICDRYNMGAYSKMIVLYDKAYWTEKGFAGSILSDCHDNPILMTFEDTRPKGNGEVQPALVVFFSATVDEEWTRDKQSCKKAVIQKLAAYYQMPELLNPIAVEMKVWNEQQTVGGGPTAYTPPGVLTKINNIREPQGRIHWAGTQTATISQGYMDGAIQSGIRVSKEILRRFKHDIPTGKQLSPNTKWYTQITTLKPKGFLSYFRWW